MPNIKDLTIIFEDNPISRAYLQFFISNGLTENKLIYLRPKSIFPNILLNNLTFNKNNFYPLKFLKNENVKKLTHDIENFFELEQNFLLSMYKYENLINFKNILYTKNNDINSSENFELILNLKEENFLNTGKQILKKIFLTKKNFFHIHPGYLPKVRGADSSLHSINLYNKIAGSLFMMDEKIDTGKIIFRDEMNYKKFSLKNLSDYAAQDLYRIWFSFVDPAIRIWILNNVFKKNLPLNKFIEINQHEMTNYYSFFKKNELSNLFKSIF
tara:strand:- start:68 stop:880 length:813 start_codon:yes stop_codon:yes gene_type:complete